MVLPSNSSPNTYPRNIAADYIVGWDRSIELDPNENWKVALTEASYIYHPHTISSNLSIEYEYMQTVATHLTWLFSIQLEFNGLLNVTPLQKLAGPDTSFKATGLTLTVKDNKFLELTGKQYFSIVNEKHFGISGVSTQTENGDYHLVGTKDIHEALTPNYKYQPIDVRVQIYLYNFRPAVSEFKFPNDQTFKTPALLFTYLQENCKAVFNEITATTAASNKRMIFTMGNKVFRIKFNGGLNFVLGFYESEFKMVNPDQLKTYNANANPSTYQADLPPQLNRGVKNIYIYASCCAPVYVGHTRVPLLKNIFVDASQDANIQGHVRNLSIQNPMYVNVAATTLNSIEINMRNDAGNIIGFPKGAITVLTLHFKKFQR
ncbi:MAG TPA: hypothetical protein DCQ63_02390 [Planktothrix sp. UBA8402]|nr:hypothetical protein [Planktothrix sp. UBA8402]